MANARLSRFITEVAPAQFKSVVRHRTSKMLDTIHEEERESGAKILAPPSHIASTKTNMNLLKKVMLYFKGLMLILGTCYNSIRWVVVSLFGKPDPTVLQNSVMLQRAITRFISPIQSLDEELLGPYSLVADDLSIIANRLRSMVVIEVPKLASAAEYFFRTGVEGKRFRPLILLLMARALNVTVPRDADVDASSVDLRSKQMSLAETTEMIHVASLLHDDVIDNADMRRGIDSVNSVMGNKLAVLAGDFLLSRACKAFISLKHTEVACVMAEVVEHLVTGETMQMSATSDQRCSMEYYMQKTYYKTASLISHSCKAISLVAENTLEVSTLAYEYGKNLGLAFQVIDDILDFTGTSTSLGKGSLSDIRQGTITAPILFAMEEFPELRTVVDKGFDDTANVDLALHYLGKSRGIERARELATKHAKLAAAAIDSLPENDDEDVQKTRHALIELTHIVITRTK